VGVYSTLRIEGLCGTNLLPDNGWLDANKTLENCTPTEVRHPGFAQGFEKSRIRTLIGGYPRGDRVMSQHRADKVSQGLVTLAM